MTTPGGDRKGSTTVKQLRQKALKMREREGSPLRSGISFCNRLMLRVDDSAWLCVTIASFMEQHCLFPFGTNSSLGANIDDNLYLIPAMTYTSILILSSTVYTLRFLLQYWKYRRYKTVAPQKTKWTMRHFPKVAGVAGLIILERVIYRHTSTFALGLELVILKVR
jgi:hypothetical protein